MGNIIDLNEFVEGAVLERVNREMRKVLENIAAYLTEELNEEVAVGTIYIMLKK